MQKKEVPKWQKDKERFIEKKIEINIDGRYEVWEREETRFAESTLWIKYKLKDSGNYKTGV